jgi:hypothetical protein
MGNHKPDNDRIARLLEQIADLLEQQAANPHRVRAYRYAARNVRTADKPLRGMLKQGGQQALQDIPGIGQGLSATIAEYIHTGRSNLLDRLNGNITPEDLFVQVPGIGEELAGRIASQLEVDTLEELEQAAHDGRLEKVKGFGPRRVQSVKASLAGMLSRSAQRRSKQRIASGEEKGAPQLPGVDVLLDVDAEYRRKAKASELRKIAPRRFNPSNKAWLPILHTSRGDWSFTALFSNTSRAHELKKTNDWVVIYYEQNGLEDQCTVVTETSGLLEGKRVVRGRESECRRYYQANE